MSDVSDTTRTPTHHVSLTKDGTTVAFNLCNSRGEIDPLAIRQDLQPRMSIKMHQGGTKHSDYEPPYATLEQRDWSGGRGLDDMDLDESRYFDSRAAHTWNEGKIILGPQYIYGTEYRNSETNMWDVGYDYLPMYGTYKGYAVKFTASATYTAARVSVILKRTGSPTSVTVSIVADNAGDPGALIDSATITSTQDIPEQVVVTLSAALTSGTDYHVTVRNASTAWTATDHYSVLAGVLTGHAQQTSDSSWTNYGEAPYFRVTDAETPFRAFFIDYTEIPYVVLDYEDATLAPKIFRNGEFGRLTAGTANTVLTDASKTWTVNEWAGAKIVIHSGSGSDDATRYRTIASNTATQLTIDTKFDRTLNTSSTYSIIDTNIWKEVTGHGLKSYHTVTDFISTGSLAYIARGDGNSLVEMRYPSLVGVGTGFTAQTGYGGTFLEVATDSNGDLKLWMARRHLKDGGAQYILKSDIPYGDRRGTYGELDWGYTVEITNGTMEADSSWSNVGSPTTNERSSEQAHSGTYSRKIVADADNEGIYQEITGLIEGDTYTLYGYAYGGSGSANGIKLKFGGTELDSTDVNEDWLLLSGSFTATATSHNVEFLSDGGAATFYIDNVYIFKQSSSLQNAGYEKITGLIAYGEPERLFVATNGGLYMESNGKYLSIPIRDMKAALDERNGLALVVHDVYLFTSFLDGLERYYKSNLDDMGPNRDEGLPSGRRGNFSKLTVYPGRIYGAYDGGDSDTSSVLMYNSFGWHEVWRAPAAGLRISSVFVQPIPGDDVDKLWIACGSDLLWVPVDLNPQNNSDYNYTYASVVEMQSIFYGKKDIEKYWSSLKLVTENLSSVTKERVFVDYKVDDETSWTNIGEYNTSSYQSIDIDDSSGNNVTGRRLRLRLRLETGVAASTPEVKAVALDFIEQVPVKESWSMTFLAEDESVTLQGVSNNERVETGVAQLQTWLDEPDPVALAAWSSLIDGKNVKILSMSYKPILTAPRAQKEKLVCTMTVIET